MLDGSGWWIEVYERERVVGERKSLEEKMTLPSMIDLCDERFLNQVTGLMEGVSMMEVKGQGVDNYVREAPRSSETRPQ